MKKTPVYLAINDVLTYDYTCAKCKCKHKIFELKFKGMFERKAKFDIEEMNIHKLSTCPILMRVE